MLCALCSAFKSVAVVGRTALHRLSHPHSLPNSSFTAAPCSRFSAFAATPRPSTSKKNHGESPLAVGGIASVMAESARLAVAPAFLYLPMGSNPARSIGTQVPLRKSEDWKAMLRSMPKRDEGTEGERDILLDPTHAKDSNLVEFPDENTPHRLYNGVPFSQLPVICVRTHKNNTIIILADTLNKVISRTSCDKEGFKNCRKGTNVAAQTTAIAMAKRAQELGVKQVRVKMRGFGPGRAASIKGFQLGGLDVVSITDITYINWRNNPRPRKQKRL